MSLRSAWLPSLHVFASAARHQNLAHAADELHLTASAVSHHVRKLETLLGVMLFQRHARGVALTPEGSVLADAVAAAVTDIDAAIGALAGLRRPQGAQRVRVNVLPSLAACWLVPRLSRFAAAHPQIRLTIETERTLTRFDAAGPDLVVRHGPGRWPGLTAHFLMDDALFPAAAPTLPGLGEIAAPAQIASLPLIFDLGLEGWREWFRAAGVRTVRLANMHTFSDADDALNAAAGGLGVVLARKHLVQPFLADGRLVRLPGPILPTRFAYYAVHPAERTPSPAAAALIDWLQREAHASSIVANAMA
ncbi:MAG TPA: LysR substrate-binding domain-containing protein [Mizugakiibacter sp.]